MTTIPLHDISVGLVAGLRTGAAESLKMRFETVLKRVLNRLILKHVLRGPVRVLRITNSQGLYET